MNTTIQLDDVEYGSFQQFYSGDTVRYIESYVNLSCYESTYDYLNMKSLKNADIYLFSMETVTVWGFL